MSWYWKQKPTWRKDLITYNSHPCIMFSFNWLVIIWRGGFVWNWTCKVKRMEELWTYIDKGGDGSWKLDNFHGRHMCIILYQLVGSWFYIYLNLIVKFEKDISEVRDDVISIIILFFLLSQSFLTCLVQLDLAYFTKGMPDTSETSVTRVLYKRHKCTGEKFYILIRTQVTPLDMANERLHGKEQLYFKNYLLEKPRSHAKMCLKIAPWKLKLCTRL